MFKQPIMIAYIIAGIVLGPSCFGLIQSSEGFSTFSQIGISLLLFLVGLGLNLKHIKETGKTAAIITLSQTAICTGLYFLLSKFLGFNDITAVFLGLGLSFSSTIVIMKILSDKMVLDGLPGQLSVGILILQDLLAMFTLMMVSATSKGGDLTNIIFLTLGNGLILIGLLFIFSWKVLPIITKKIANSQEMLLLFSIGWCMAIASLFYLMDFSIEIGALLAGITLSLSPFRLEIMAKMKPLRDFFIMLFFVSLGAQMYFQDIGGLLIPTLIFSTLILLLNPTIVTILMGRLGYTKKTSFLAGINFSQISEFSLILASLGLRIGQIDRSILSMLTLISLITITGSTYFMIYSEKIFLGLSPLLKFIEKKGEKIDQIKKFSPHEHDIVLIGYAKMGMPLLETFRRLHKNTFVVDYDPKIIQELNRQNIDCLYGDISNLETLEELDLSKAKMVICTLKDIETNLILINKVRKINPDCILIVLTHQVEEALQLYEKGANYVIMPYHIGGHHTSTMIADYGLDLEKFLIEKKKHVSKLLIRKELGQSRHT